MSKQEFYPSFAPHHLFQEEIAEKQPYPELIDEVSEGVNCCIMLITICDIIPLLILTIALLFTIPPLAPLGIIGIAVLIHQSLKKLKEIE